MKHTTNKVTIRRHILLLAMLTWAGLGMKAQNSIDEFVDKLSNPGTISITSIVERDPKTRKVEKTVKTVRINGPGASGVWDLFDKEDKNGTSIESRQDGKYTRILAVRTKTTSRIYSIKADKPKARICEVTIIVRLEN